MYELMKNDIKEFDTSDYAEDNQFSIPRANKKVIGLMKDECNGKIMTQFVGLRSKMYSLKMQGASYIKKAKGVKGTVVKKTITFNDYMHCLRDNIIVMREQCNIRSRLHILHSERQQKIALSTSDDKRYLQDGRTDTVPWGHYSIIPDELFEQLFEEGDEAVASAVVEGVLPEMVVGQSCAELSTAGEGSSSLEGMNAELYKKHSWRERFIHSSELPATKKSRTDG